MISDFSDLLKAGQVVITGGRMSVEILWSAFKSIKLFNSFFKAITTFNSLSLSLSLSHCFSHWKNAIHSITSRLLLYHSLLSLHYWPSYCKQPLYIVAIVFLATA